MYDTSDMRHILRIFRIATILRRLRLFKRPNDQFFWCGDRSSELFYILINILRGVWGVGAGLLPPSKKNLTGPNAFRGVWGVRPPAKYNICILTPSSPIVIIIIIITYHHLSSPITILRLQRKKYCASGENILGSWWSHLSNYVGVTFKSVSGRF